MQKVILGICAFNHDSAAALIVNGRLCGFIEEERITEQKSTGAFPINAIKELLSNEELHIDSVTDIAFYFDVKQLILSYLRNNNPISLVLRPRNFISGRFIYEFIWMFNFILKARRIPALLKSKNAKIHYYPHHDCHIWYAIYAANQRTGIVISNDSIGEQISSIAKRWRTSETGKILTQKVFKQNSPHSIGYLYGAVTEKLGFNRQSGAGKVMALASFCKKADASYFLDRITLNSDGRFKFKNGLIVDRTYKPSANRIASGLKKHYEVANNRDTTHHNLAFGVQKATEKIVLHQVQTVAQFSKNIVLTGGVAQNSVVNGILASKFNDHNIIVPPIPHDSGCAIGAALLCSYSHSGKLPEFRDTAFLGNEYTDDEILAFLTTRGIKFEKFKHRQDCNMKLASILIEGKTIGLFRGPMECGPRALGNRSIIALPNKEGITTHLNNNVKYREAFRPYGVIVCETKLHHYFDVPKQLNQLPYMAHVFELKEAYHESLRNVMHVDKTCRIQTSSNADVFLHDLFDTLESEGYFRLIINTSLNVMGKPISRTVGQALSCFYTSGLDHILFNEKFMVSK